MLEIPEYLSLGKMIDSPLMHIGCEYTLARRKHRAQVETLRWHLWRDDLLGKAPTQSSAPFDVEVCHPIQTEH